MYTENQTNRKPTLGTKQNETKTLKNEEKEEKRKLVSNRDISSLQT
jgi:hypothetical protein